MAPAASPRAQRVGGVEVAPGRSARVQIGPPGAAPVEGWIAVGRAPGPRVTVVAAEQGFEAAAALAARALMAEVEPASLVGSLLVVPVFRPGGRFARPGRVARGVALPGDAGGSLRARLAFALYSDVVVSAQAVVVLGAPRPGRRAPLLAEVAAGDVRARKLALAVGPRAVVEEAPRPGSLLAAAAQAGRIAVRLCFGGGVDGVGPEAAALLAGVRRFLAAMGLQPSALAAGRERDASPVVTARARVRSPADGLLEEAVEPGAVVRKGAVLARLGGPIPGPAGAVLAPATGLVLESPAGPAARKGAVLFVLGELPPALGRGAPQPAPAPFGPDPGAKLRTGWIERVSLPDLGIASVPAKIDTGARTSALHVISTRVVGTAAGPSRRPILELTLPAGGASRRRLVVRAAVKDEVEVRDTSGRTETRPVIETTLELGTLRRRIRLTLTDRGDMRCPMLVGRSALGGAVLVDPAARFLLDAPAQEKGEQS